MITIAQAETIVKKNEEIKKLMETLKWFKQNSGGLNISFTSVGQNIMFDLLRHFKSEVELRIILTNHIADLLNKQRQDFQLELQKLTGELL